MLAASETLLRLRFAVRPTVSPAVLTASALGVLALVLALTPLPLLLPALALTAAAIVTLIYPWLAWLALAFALPAASAWRVGPGSVSDAILAGGLFLWVASAVAHRRPRLAARIPLWPVSIYVITLYLSTLGARDLDEALTEMVKWIEFGLLLWAVPLVLPNQRLRWLVVALLAAAATQGIYGLYQFIFRIGPDWFLIQGRFMRASGVFGQPNPFGAYLGLSLPVAFSLALWSIFAWLRQRSWAHAGAAVFFTLATVCIAVGLFASWSRGAWLGAAAGITVVLALLDRRTAFAVATGALVVTLAALLGSLNPSWIPAAISGRIADIPAYLGLVDVLALEVNDDNFAVIERMAHWVAALRMWESAPWLGVGPGNYAAAYAAVALPRWSDPLGHAHNIYLNVLGETGVLGFVAFLVMWFTLVRWLVSHAKTRMAAQSWERAMTIGVLGVLTHLAVHSFFDNLFVQGMYLHLAFWLAAVAIAAGPLVKRDAP